MSDRVFPFTLLRFPVKRQGHKADSSAIDRLRLIDPAAAEAVDEFIHENLRNARRKTARVRKPQPPFAS